MSDCFWFSIIGLLAGIFVTAIIMAITFIVLHGTRKRKILYRFTTGKEGIQEGYVVDETDSLIKLSDIEPSGSQPAYSMSGKVRNKPIYATAWHNKTNIEVVRG